MRIQVAEPQFVGNERAYVNEALDRAWVTSGPYVERFEAAWAEFVGARHAVACGNGTHALHLALLAAGIGPGDEVIVPALTYVATANAVTYCGARPVFVDVDSTWCLDLGLAERAITAHTRAILPVHLYGGMPDMDWLAHLAATRRLAVVEDAAEAVGSYWNGTHAGTLGRLGAFSLFGNKTLTCGEGGVVVTDSEPLARRIRKLSRQGGAAVGVAGYAGHWYAHDEIGFNYRMTDLQAAVGLAQVESREWHLRRRAEVAAFYAGAVLPEGVERQPTRLGVARVPWMNAVLVPDRDGVMRRMAARGVETRPVFLPLPALPMYAAASGAPCPVAHRISARGLCLPTHAGLGTGDLGSVLQALAAAVGREVAA